MSKAEKGCASSEILEVGLRSMQPDCVLQDVGSRPCPNWDAESSSPVKLPKTIEGSDCGEASNTITEETGLKSVVGKSITTSTAVLPPKMGFGPWLNLGYGRSSDGENPGAPFKNMVDAATNGHAFCKEVQGNSQLAPNESPNCALGISLGKASTTPVLCKSLLSPSPSKLGLPPRPPSQKSLVFQPASKVASLACGPGGGVLHKLAFENEPRGQTPMTQEKLDLGVQCRELGKHEEATAFRVGSTFQEPKVIEGSVSNLSWHNKVIADCSISPAKVGTGGISSKHQSKPVKFERGNVSVTAGQHIGSSSDVGTGRMLEDGARNVVNANVLSSTPGMDVQMKPVDFGTEISTNGSTLQAARLEISRSMVQQSLTGEGSYGKKVQVNKQVSNASTSETLPWELIIEPAGAIQKARENFVEAYNRARKELKNQRLSQTINRTSGGELDGGPKLTLGSSGATLNARIEWQSFKHRQQSPGPLQFLENNSKVEHQILLHSKVQNAMTTIEGSQCKQAEGLQQIQPAPKGPLESCHKTVLQEANTEASVRRPGKGSMTRDEGPGKPIYDWKELISKLDNDVKCTSMFQGSSEVQKQIIGQECAPLLSKRSRVTFEDHEMPTETKKDEASKLRPQSKPHLWLQRWHSTPKYNSSGFSADTQIAPDGKRSNSSNCQTLCSKRLREEDGIGVSGQARASAERVKWLETNSLKILPSAAAMAIVGTAARQFCSSQLQGKGSFAFWSGFGMSAHGEVQHVQQKGKEKVCLNAIKNLPSC